ncbi:MAG TPA: hypothetical protein VHS99_16225, partial [Chloroflexota bacterium]|nr:hypothetical protein [Chloroflexota bacterium]
LIDTGAPVYAAHVVRWDVNITYPQDLLDTNLRLLRERRLDSLVGDGARISPQAQLSTSVVGMRAVIDAPVRLEECLVLADTHITEYTGEVRRHIFADGLVWAADAIPSPDLVGSEAV